MSTTLSPTSPTATSAPPSAPTHNPGTTPGSGFAQMLSAQQAEAAPTPSEPTARRDAAPEATAPAAQKPRAPEPPAHDKPKADKGKPGRAEPPRRTDKATAEDASTDKPHATDPTDAALAPWLTALQPPPMPTAPPTGPHAALGAELPAELGKPHAARRGAQHDSRHTLTEATAGAAPRRGLAPVAADTTAERLPADKATPAHADTHPDTSTTPWQAALERASTPAEAPARQELPGVSALSAAAPSAPAARSAEASAPLGLTLPTPVHAPEFTQSLGVQISVLARDGVQQAELHLNPAEMGPISVQIALDGSQAQVNFGADSATTRQIIESGLPELASALRDAGFTLSGGGVHSQAQGRREGGGSSPGFGRGAGPGAEGEEPVVAQRIQARVAAGGVDLYA